MLKNLQKGPVLGSRVGEPRTGPRLTVSTRSSSKQRVLEQIVVVRCMHTGGCLWKYILGSTVCYKTHRLAGSVSLEVLRGDTHDNHADLQHNLEPQSFQQTLPTKCTFSILGLQLAHAWHVVHRCYRWQSLGPKLDVSGAGVQMRSDAFTISGIFPNSKLDHQSGSGKWLNPGPDLGPVQPGSGPNLGSEPDCSNTTHDVLSARHSFIEWSGWSVRAVDLEAEHIHTRICL